MVYIYRKFIDAKPHYYLRLSIKEGKRVIAKDIAYLGSSIEDVQNRLDALPMYQKEIRKSYKTIQKAITNIYWDEKVSKLKLKENAYLKNELHALEACKLHFQKIFAQKPVESQKESYEQFAIDFAYNTASLEGNTITLDEARKLLNEGLTPTNKTLREIYDLQNTTVVFSKLSTYKITHSDIQLIHKTLMQNIDQRIGYRTDEIRVFKATFESSPAKYVKADMDLLLKWYSENKQKLHPIVLASIFHHKFEKIHPFMDGNGRTGRILLNLILNKSKYPPVIIEKKSRINYLNALSKADAQDPLSIDAKYYSDLAQFVASQCVKNYWNIFL